MTTDMAWNDCERIACGDGTMEITRRFATPGKPWKEVIWRRCAVCRATSVQHIYPDEA